MALMQDKEIKLQSNDGVMLSVDTLRIGIDICSKSSSNVGELQRRWQKIVKSLLLNTTLVVALSIPAQSFLSNACRLLIWYHVH